MSDRNMNYVVYFYFTETPFQFAVDINNMMYFSILIKFNIGI